MKRWLMIILLLIPFASAVNLEMKQNFQPGETLLASFQGNFLSPITPGNVYFYSGRTPSPLTFDIAKIGDKYHIYAILPNQQEDYLLVIKNLHFYENGEEHYQDLVANFSLSGNITDFSVYPGLIVSSGNFTLTLESKNSELAVSSSFLNNSEIILLKPGQKKKVTFSAYSPQITSLELSALGTSYSIPVSILAKSDNESEVSEETEKIRFSRQDYSYTVISGESARFNITLVNVGTFEIQNIKINISAGLEISPSEISSLNESESAELELEILAEEEGIFNAVITAYNENISTFSRITINSVNNSGEEVVVQDNTQQILESCEALNGVLCSAGQECDGQAEISSGGLCCIGSCKSARSYTGLIIGVVIIILIGAGLFFLYKKSRSKSKNSKEVLAETQSKIESRIQGRETRGSLSRS